MSFLSIFGAIFLMCLIAVLNKQLKEFYKTKNIKNINFIHLCLAIWSAIVTILLLNVGPGFYVVNFWNK